MSPPFIKQLAPPLKLRIRTVLDLQPRTRASVRAVDTSLVLGHDAFQVSLTGEPKKVGPSALDVVEHPYTTLVAWKQASQTPFTLNQRHLPQDFSINRQHVKRIEERRFATEQQILEIASAVRVEAANLAIEHSRVRSH